MATLCTVPKQLLHAAQLQRRGTRLCRLALADGRRVRGLVGFCQRLRRRSRRRLVRGAGTLDRVERCVAHGGDA